MLRATVICGAALFTWLVAAEFPLRQCPEPKLRPQEQSEEDDDRAQVNLIFKSQLPVGMDVVWVNGEGGEVAAGQLGALPGENKARLEIWASPGDIFRVYAKATATTGSERVLLQEFAAKRRPREQHVEVVGCGVVEEVARAARVAFRKRAAEFEALAHPGPDETGAFPLCGPTGQSEKWSCVRFWPAEECRRRHENEPEYAGKDRFGFWKASGKRAVGTHEDHDDVYEWHRTNIPRVTSGPGFQKMTMPEPFRSNLLTWYGNEVKAGLRFDTKSKRKVRPILNNDDAPTAFVGMTEAIARELKSELRQVLEWWTNWTALKHTATYGARVYSRGSVLLNHMDRLETHLASAILQVGQSVDQDGGWPVEILTDTDGCYEIFLQPGEMLLYEGASFRHGRPMALRGESFANIFTHFAPAGWMADEAGKQAHGEDEDEDDEDGEEDDDEEEDDEGDDDDEGEEEEIDAKSGTDAEL